MIFAAGEVECAGGPLETAKNGSWKEPSFDLKPKGGKVVSDEFYKAALGLAGSRNNPNHPAGQGKGVSTIRMTQMETEGSDMQD